jgi:multiple sugar transport system permease protein
MAQRTTALPRADAGQAAGKPRRERSFRAGWLYVAPALVILLALTIVPAIYLLYSSFFDYTLLNEDARKFVGFDNYGHVFSDPNIRGDFGRTFLFVGIAVTLEMAFGVLLAVPLAARSRGNTVATTLLLLPFAITPAVSALVFRQLLDPNFGWIDHYLGAIGIMGEPVEWLSNPTTAWIALIGLDVWQWTPFVALILIAGLQGVPEEPQQAAALDGAKRWQVFVHITLPLLLPFVAVALLLRLVEAFKTFASVQVLTGGGPGRSTELVNLTVYRVALQDFSVGAAAALGIVFLIVLALIIPQVLRALSRRTDLFEDA